MHYAFDQSLAVLCRQTTQNNQMTSFYYGEKASSYYIVSSSQIFCFRIDNSIRLNYRLLWDLSFLLHQQYLRPKFLPFYYLIFLTYPCIWLKNFAGSNFLVLLVWIYCSFKANNKDGFPIGWNSGDQQKSYFCQRVFFITYYNDSVGFLVFVYTVSQANLWIQFWYSKYDYSQKNDFGLMASHYYSVSQPQYSYLDNPMLLSSIQPCFSDHWLQSPHPQINVKSHPTASHFLTKGFWKQVSMRLQSFQICLCLEHAL